MARISDIRWIDFSEDDAGPRRRRRYPAAKPQFRQRVEDNAFDLRFGRQRLAD